jgi:hypothetical protein
MLEGQSSFKDLKKSTDIVELGFDYPTRAFLADDGYSINTFTKGSRGF